MKTLLTAALIAFSGISFSAHATTSTNAAQPQWVQAVVKKIDKPNGRVVLAHGDLPNGMPAMTMAFGIKKIALLDQMMPGQKIRFTIPADGALTVERFEPVK